MAGYMGDLGDYWIPSSGNVNSTKRGTSGSGFELDMTDFLTLMVTELTNQSIDQTADTSDMLNQMVQMQMVQALVNMTDASIMSYAASLVGKEVTVGQFDSNGVLQEVVGVVQGTGTLNGQQVIFVNDRYYYLSEIMAVGRLPQSEEASGGETGGDGSPDAGSIEPAPNLDAGFGVDHDVNVEQDSDLIPGFGIDAEN